MNDPWDVKSVRQGNQYVSCMKINGVPLLPPVLSKECRKEMQYYKILAREVEKRISILKPYFDSDTDSNEDRTDAPELPEYEQSYALPPEEIRAGFDVNIDKITALTEKHLQNYPSINSSITSNVTVKTTKTSFIESPKFHIDLSLSINETGKSVLENMKTNPHSKSPPIELPEHDNEKKPEREVLTDVEMVRRHKDDFQYSIDSDFLSGTDPIPGIPVKQDGPSSLSSKSFTGSLNDIHTESVKEDLVPKLIRQHSYTLLKPSPQLIAHLEVQSLQAGVDMTSISMSESLSNLSSSNKKRRSWDLESAKVKWSTMAMELKRTNVINLKTSTGTAKCISNNGNSNVQNNINHVSRSVPKKASTISPPRAISLTTNIRRGSLNLKTLPKSEPIQNPKGFVSPVRNTPSNQTIVKEYATPKTLKRNKESVTPKLSTAIISKSDDPATRVRELYENIQKQQLMQMASLVEKQKREQVMLQQVFEEQNNLLYKQLKTICPKSPVEVKEAWGDKTEDRGPVSLSQLIKPKSPIPHSMSSIPMSSTLTETNNYINRCDNVLKKSRDITSNIKKQPQKCMGVTGTNGQSPKPHTEGSKTRTHSPTQRCTSRKLNYDTSASSDREQEPMLTDRTNDTMADLNNMTFPSDSDEYMTYLHNSSPNQIKEDTKRSSALTKTESLHRSTDNAIRCLEDSIQLSMDTMNTQYKSNTRAVTQSSCLRPPNAKELEAATTIVAYAKGYLVRRLMRTERVQATVQTIRDALLCALELHRDREGIRGADVDLHRRLIQQITAACYKLHDTFVASSPAERCAVIAADRARRRLQAARGAASPLSRTHSRQTDVMSLSHTGSFPARTRRQSSTSLMTQSNYETFSGNKGGRARCLPSPRRLRPWR